MPKRSKARPAPRVKAPPPFAFVLDAMEELEPQTRSMFGCLALYLGEKIVLILRDKPDYPRDNGVWLATTPEHHASLARDFPSMRTIALFGAEVSGWQVLPSDSDDFEETALRAVKFVKRGDPRIGKIPARKKKKKK